jgi:hypothetical protein
LSTRQDSFTGGELGDAKIPKDASFFLDGGGSIGLGMGSISKRQRLKSWISKKGSIATRSILGSGVSGVSDGSLEGEDQQGEGEGSKQLLTENGELLVNIAEFSITFK